MGKLSFQKELSPFWGQKGHVAVAYLVRGREPPGETGEVGRRHRSTDFISKAMGNQGQALSRKLT